MMARRSAGTLPRDSAGVRGLLVVLSLAGAASCGPKEKVEPGTGAVQSMPAATGTTADLSKFWSGADDTIHEAQTSLRSARLVAERMGEAVPENYKHAISLGHGLGGLGHDHVTPSDNKPVISMLDTMADSIDSLIREAGTTAEIEEASRATTEDLSALAPRTQRLFHLLNAKKKVALVRDRATAAGFRPAG